MTNLPTEVTNAFAIATNIVEPNINGLDVVNRVNAFYTSAFQNTVWLVGALITLLGLAVPTAYYFLQKRQLELNEANLEKKLSEYLKTELAKLEKSLREENASFLKDEKVATQEKFEGLEKKINGKLDHARGGIFMVQGNFENERKNHLTAFTSYIDAVGAFAKISALKLVQKNLHFATNHLVGLNKAHFKESGLTKKVEELIEGVQKLEAKGLLDEDIRKFKSAFSEAQGRDK